MTKYEEDEAGYYEQSGDVREWRWKKSHEPEPADETAEEKTKPKRGRPPKSKTTEGE